MKATVSDCGCEDKVRHRCNARWQGDCFSPSERKLLFCFSDWVGLSLPSPQLVLQAVLQFVGFLASAAIGALGSKHACLTMFIPYFKMSPHIHVRACSSLCLNRSGISPVFLNCLITRSSLFSALIHLRERQQENLTATAGHWTAAPLCVCMCVCGAEEDAVGWWKWRVGLQAVQSLGEAIRRGISEQKNSKLKKKFRHYNVNLYFQFSKCISYCICEESLHAFWFLGFSSTTLLGSLRNGQRSRELVHYAFYLVQ